MMTEMEGLSYASFWRRFAVWLIDLAALLFVLFLVLVAMKLLREVGAWAPAAASVPGEPVAIWKGLGFNAKLFVIVAYLLSLGRFTSSSSKPPFPRSCIGRFGKTTPDNVASIEERCRVERAQREARRAARQQRARDST
jgi:hypothetical protein